MKNMLFTKLFTVPSKTQLALMLKDIINECNVVFEQTAKGVQKGLLPVAKSDTNGPNDMTEKFSKRINTRVVVVQETFERRD